MKFEIAHTVSLIANSCEQVKSPDFPLENGPNTLQKCPHYSSLYSITPRISQLYTLLLSKSLLAVNGPAPKKKGESANISLMSFSNAQLLAGE